MENIQASPSWGRRGKEHLGGTQSAPFFGHRMKPPSEILSHQVKEEAG